MREDDGRDVREEEEAGGSVAGASEQRLLHVGCVSPRRFVEEEEEEEGEGRNRRLP